MTIAVDLGRKATKQKKETAGDTRYQLQATGHRLLRLL